MCVVGSKSGRKQCAAPLPISPLHCWHSALPSALRPSTLMELRTVSNHNGCNNDGEACVPERDAGVERRYGLAKGARWRCARTSYSSATRASAVCHTTARAKTTYTAPPVWRAAHWRRAPANAVRCYSCLGSVTVQRCHTRAHCCKRQLSDNGAQKRQTCRRVAPHRVTGARAGLTAVRVGSGRAASRTGVTTTFCGGRLKTRGPSSPPPPKAGVPSSASTT